MTKIFAYLYCDPLLETSLSSIDWELEVEKVYQDLGERQQWQQLVQDCQVEPPDCLLIRRLEDLGDSVITVNAALMLLEGLGIEVIATEQSYRSSQFTDAEASDRRINLIKLLSEVQVNQRRRRLCQGHARNRLKALPPPGKAPYGYRRGKDRYIVDRSTAPVVKDFVERFLLFGSLRGAVRYLAKKYGKKISVSTGHRWLTNPVYRGDLAYRSGEIIPDTHIAIISEEEAAQVDRLLRRNSRLPPRTASAPRSLAGLVVCQQCQSAMKVSRVTTRNKKREYLYLCPVNCTRETKCGAIAYAQILQGTIERICQDLPAAVAQMNASGIEGIKQALQEQISQKKAILSQIPELQAQGILDEQTADLRAYKLRSEIAELRGKIAQLPPENLSAIAQAVSLPQFWFDLSEAERRFYFREFIKQIEIVRQDHQQWELQLRLVL